VLSKKRVVTGWPGVCRKKKNERIRIFVLCVQRWLREKRKRVKGRKWEG
jgi:hypothetical protein